MSYSAKSVAQDTDFETQQAAAVAAISRIWPMQTKCMKHIVD
jgi:hypothetical protein